MLRLLRRVSLVLAILATSLIVGVAPAQASHVSGLEIEPGSEIIGTHYHLKPGTGTLLAVFYVYLDDDGDKFGKLVLASGLQGSSRYMQAIILLHGEEIGATPCHDTVRCDDGQYAYFAGPIVRINISGDCVDLLSSVQSPPGGTTYTQTWANVDCD